MAVVPKFLIGKFQSKIVEGLIFEISNFNVKNQKKTYQVVEKPYKIEFRPNTGIIKLLGDEIKILKYKFDFFSLDQIESRYGNDTCLLGKFIFFLNEYHCRCDYYTNIMN